MQRVFRGSRLGIGLVVLALTTAALALATHALGAQSVANGSALALIHVVAKPKSYQDLAAQASPQIAGQPEAVVWKYFDTQTYLQAGSATLAYFANTNADKTLCNLDAASAIAAPNYFEVVAFTCDYLSVVTNGNATVATGALSDIANICNTARALFTFTYNNKPYLQVPLRDLPSAGMFAGLLQGTTAANQIEQFGANTPYGGIAIDKALTIAPNNNFGATIQFAASNTAITANLGIQIGMVGVLHRKVG